MHAGQADKSVRVRAERCHRCPELNSPPANPLFLSVLSAWIPKEGKEGLHEDGESVRVVMGRKVANVAPMHPLPSSVVIDYDDDILPSARLAASRVLVERELRSLLRVLEFAESRAGMAPSSRCLSRRESGKKEEERGISILRRLCERQKRVRGKREIQNLHHRERNCCASLRVSSGAGE